MLMTNYSLINLFVFGATAPPPQWARASSFTRFIDHTQRRTTVVRTSLEEWSARRRDLYLTTHNTDNRKTSMYPVGFEPHNLNTRAAADLRLWPRGHWDRQLCCIATLKLLEKWVKITKLSFMYSSQFIYYFSNDMIKTSYHWTSSWASNF